MQLLAKLFEKNDKQPEDPQVRIAYGKMAGMVGITVNVLLFLGKLIAGLFSGSLAILADAVNNLSDAGSSVMTMLGFRLSERPADQEHPFGHARMEYLSGLVVAIMILLVGVELVQQSFGKMMHPAPVVWMRAVAAVLAVSIAVKVGLMIFYHKIGKRISSETLHACAMDSRNDALSTAAVLLGMWLQHRYGWQMDAVISLGVAAFIFVSGVLLLKETVSPLLGEAPDEKLSGRIADRLLGYPDVLNIHDLIIHDYGPGRQFASIHVEMDAAAGVMESHDKIDRIERDFWEQEHIHLVIHHDPVATDEATNAMRRHVCQVLKGIDESLTFHDFHMTKLQNRTRLSFDVVRPLSFFLTEEQLKREVVRRLQEKGKRVEILVTVDSHYTKLPQKCNKKLP